MNKHSVALLLPYYGKFPNYFPLWLKSAGANQSFTFMIFTDIDMSGYNIPPNVQVHSMTLEEIRQRAAKHLDFEPVLNAPYKVCDYRPMFGLIFEDYLAGYDFWGFCDSDVIFGDMSKYITDGLLNRYSRLYRRGHLQLFRNNDRINHFALNSLPGFNISYKDIYTTSKHLQFEELSLAENLFSIFADGVGGNMTKSYLPTYPQASSSSDAEATTYGSNTSRRSGGLMAGCTALHSTETQRLSRNICTSICRRGP